jgi:hypothetical protein
LVSSLAGLKAGFGFGFMAAETEAVAGGSNGGGGDGSAGTFVATWRILACFTVPSAILFRSMGTLAPLIISEFLLLVKNESAHGLEVNSRFNWVVTGD